MDIKSRMPKGKAEEQKSRFFEKKGSSETVILNDSPTNPVFVLQQNVGNQSVQRLLKSRTIQAKLEIGKTDNEYEREADHVAEQIMQTPVSQEPRQDDPVKLRTISTINENQYVDPVLESRINSARNGGQPLPESTRNLFESRFYHAFDRVCIHADSQAVQLARSVNARAFTVGHDLFFGEGEYSPETSKGKMLLAHELTHVLQQTGENRSWCSTNVIQRFDDDDELFCADFSPAGMIFLLQSEYEALIGHLSTHRGLMLARMESYSNLAAQGANIALSQIFRRYENDRFPGVARPFAGMLGAFGPVGNIVGNVIKLAINIGMMERNIRVSELRSNISDEILERVNEAFRDVTSTQFRAHFNRTRYMVAQEFIRIIQGISNIEGSVNLHSSDISEQLGAYITQLFDTSTRTRDAFRDAIIQHYNPIVFEAMHGCTEEEYREELDQQMRLLLRPQV